MCVSAVERISLDGVHVHMDKFGKVDLLLSGEYGCATAICRGRMCRGGGGGGYSRLI